MAESVNNETVNNKKKQPRTRRRRPVVAEDEQRAREFDCAFECLTQLVDIKSANEIFPTRGNAVFTTAVVLWMLVCQRMSPDRTLEATVKKLQSVMPGILPKNKRITEKTLSLNTSGYSGARQRLDLAAVEWLCKDVSRAIIDTTTPSLGDRRAFLVDGTTLTLAPEPALRRDYPAAKNQYGRGPWPIALMTVCHELRTGAALVPVLGKKFGPEAVSETALVPECLKQLPPDSIVMTDAGFGIFSVARQVNQAGHQFVLRLTKQRFAALIRTATLVKQEPGVRVWQHNWQPSSDERKSHPELADDAGLNVQIHEIVINDELTLPLVTSLSNSSADLAELYRQRTNVEVDLRNMKIVMGAESIQARSHSMFMKELLAAVPSYNLTTQFRRQAAEIANVPPRRLSYKRVWTTFNIFLLSARHSTAANWRKAYNNALEIAAGEILPNRPDRRFPREAYPRRPKSNQFKKRVPKDTKNDPENNPKPSSE